MKYIQFKCTLLSDIIISQKSATEGSHKTLDFIPGNSFLGIVASGCYSELSEQDQILLFHSGCVRFGDAHPAVNFQGQTCRSLRIPAMMFSPKLSDMNPLYVHSAITDRKKLLEKQLKQCRDGFYILKDGKVLKAENKRNFAIKSAYDRGVRRAAEGKMYGYESLSKGMEFLFEVELDDNAAYLEPYIIAHLTGDKRVGRSKTAQYGWVHIEQTSYERYSVVAYESCRSSDTGYVLVSVYADGRLIFLDKEGVLTFQPTAEQLGFGSDAEIIGKFSQIRTFQYAPWNFKRQAFDTDRCGIEKGSVWVVRTKNIPSITETYIGAYRNEGFGKVLYNPDFLRAQVGQNGLAVYQLADVDDRKSISEREEKSICAVSDPLLLLLRKKKQEQDMHTQAYCMVNDFVWKNGKRFLQADFASQWGTIRCLSVQATHRQELYDSLFVEPQGYLVHGVASAKWKKNKRREILKDFFEQTNEENYRFCLINLAAEMAKKCRRE